MNCPEPGCIVIGYCRFHAKLNPVVKEKKVYVIPHQSKKRVKDQREYVKIVKEAAKVDDRCKIKSPDCTGKMEGLNHKQKRSPKNLLMITNLERACNACNNFVENNTAWAKANGHLISRFKK
jgi:hypothetical protein